MSSRHWLTPHQTWSGNDLLLLPLTSQVSANKIVNQITISFKQTCKSSNSLSMADTYIRDWLPGQDKDILICCKQDNKTADKNVSGAYQSFLQVVKILFTLKFRKPS